MSMPRRLARAGLAAALLAAAGLAASGGAPAAGAASSDRLTPWRPPPPQKTRRPARRRLSDERRSSRWAYVRARTWARSRPRRSAARVKLLETRTPDGTPELVLLLSELRDRSGRVWVRVRLPMRPNGSTGWVRRSRLGRYRRVTTRFVVDRRRFRAVLTRRGRVAWRAPVGVGQPRWPTPPGRFYVRERLYPTNPGGLYGSFAFGLSAYSKQLTDWPGGGMIGVHGTNEPGLIPGRISHGCIRVRNAQIRRLARLMGLGTPVVIK